MGTKYFIDKICDVSINNKQVIISNNMNGKWIKIPQECYLAIKYSTENSLSLNEVMSAFEDINDRKYFEKVINKLEYIGLISEKNIKDTTLRFVNKVSISMTNRCNLSCDYCCADSNPVNKDFLSTSDIKLSIDNIMKLNPYVLVFTGGEPLLRSDFFDILEYTKMKFNGKIVLATNATLIKESQIDTLINNIYSLEISLDGYDEESCTEVRGHGVFSRVIKVIELFKAKGFNNITLSMVVGKHNSNDIDKFYKLNEYLGTKPLIRNFMSIGRGKEVNKKYIDNNNAIEYESEDLSEISASQCTAGNTQISINDKGDVFPCPILEYDEFKMFNILHIDDDIIEKIYTRKLKAFQNFDKLKPKNIESCGNCKINLFCTTCPAKMYLLKQDQLKFDYNCTNTKKHYENKIWK